MSDHGVCDDGPMSILFAGMCVGWMLCGVFLQAFGAHSFFFPWMAIALSLLVAAILIKPDGRA